MNDTLGYLPVIAVTPDGTVMSEQAHTGDSTALQEQMAEAVKLVRKSTTVGLPAGLSLLHRGGMPLRRGRKDTLARRSGACSDVKGSLEPVTTSRKNGVGRNAPCPCGSGLKNKRCRCR